MPLSFISQPDGNTLAVQHYRPAKPRANSPTLLWLGGLRSDITGSKAQTLLKYARRRRVACTLVDHFAHGRSSGSFKNATVSRWRRDAVNLVKQHISGPVLPVGSSMGAWIALLLAQSLPKRIHSLLLLAPAPDFTHKLLLPSLSPAQLKSLRKNGVVILPSQYDPDGYPIHQTLINDAKPLLLLNSKPIHTPFRVRILHGTNDVAVPETHARTLFNHLDSPDAALILVKNGDHRLSSPTNLTLFQNVLNSLLSS